MDIDTLMTLLKQYDDHHKKHHSSSPKPKEISELHGWLKHHRKTVTKVKFNTSNQLVVYHKKNTSPPFIIPFPKTTIPNNWTDPYKTRAERLFKAIRIDTASVNDPIGLEGLFDIGDDAVFFCKYEKTYYNISLPGTREFLEDSKKARPNILTGIMERMPEDDRKAYHEQARLFFLANTAKYIKVEVLPDIAFLFQILNMHYNLVKLSLKDTKPNPDRKPQQEAIKRFAIAEMRRIESSIRRKCCDIHNSNIMRCEKFLQFKIEEEKETIEYNYRPYKANHAGILELQENNLIYLLLLYQFHLNDSHIPKKHQQIPHSHYEEAFSDKRIDGKSFGLLTQIELANRLRNIGMEGLSPYIILHLFSALKFLLVFWLQGAVYKLKSLSDKSNASTSSLSSSPPAPSKRNRLGL